MNPQSYPILRKVFLKRFKIMKWIVLSLGLALLTFSSRGYTQADSVRVSTTTKTIDPCSVATPDQLKMLISAGIGGGFPLKHSKGGKHVTISKPRLSDLNCPNLRISIKAKINYKVTRGVPQFSTSGHLRFSSPLLGRVTYKAGSSGTPQPSDVVKAEALMTDIAITELNLKRVPNWLDNTWMKDCLNGELPLVGELPSGEVLPPTKPPVCKGIPARTFDITEYVKIYLQQGGSL